MIIGAVITDIRLIKEHEEINKAHLNKLVGEIKKNRFVTPILVEINSYVILDGHHRYNAIKKLGLKLIPAYFVDYDEVELYPRREDIKVTKELVLKVGNSSSLFPYKTTRHVISGMKDLKIDLELLEE